MFKKINSRFDINSGVLYNIFINILFLNIWSNSALSKKIGKKLLIYVLDSY